MDVCSDAYINKFIACVAGAMIICVDLIIRRIPGKHNFRIQDSNTFLSASLSLSFGVMVSLENIVSLPPDFLLY